MDRAEYLTIWPLFEALHIATAPSDMKRLRREYCGVFCSEKNILNAPGLETWKVRTKLLEPDDESP